MGGHDGSRHRDEGGWLGRFVDRVLVVCPRCAGRALVTPAPDLPPAAYAGQLLVAERRLSCAGCGAVAAWQPERIGGALIGVSLGGTEDPFFRHPLWLQTRCAGEVLWAYNQSHVVELTAYVGARLRERGPVRPTTSMFARLPVWMKRAGNRDELLAGLARLQALAARGSPGDRPDLARPRGDRARHRRGPHFGGA
ncbi:hypothetical protein [Streptomyces profundus]|uniref:hypothetical protein n=1 Tax=Streptomyces profundus TaxID=2867410 RepID=UPI001D1618C2|nr:hypothetical protein [Streptomyces sp. MA3_2.13]UED84895.1 hypothetical protein K4G22_12330 [Streptomyces sp. MA3_2.13]